MPSGVYTFVVVSEGFVACFSSIPPQFSPLLDCSPPAFLYDEETAESRQRFRVRDLVRRYGPETPKDELLLEGGDSEASVVLLYDQMIGVKILGSPMPMAYEGVLLHTDFVSKIAFVKILRCEEQLPAPKCQELDCMEKVSAQVVAAGCTQVYGHWLNAICCYSVGLCRYRSLFHQLGIFVFILGIISLVPSYGASVVIIIAPASPETAIKSIDDDTESTESHNARTSGQLIKASCCIEESAIRGALVSRHGGLLGVIHNVRDLDIQATPIGDVLKYLEYLEEDG
ncbi:hypothetical protein RHGRI_026750 [Rhododendron griersonianum]|uniref:Uncharacterized protein n=1 Tax=Rhododendron griersonianum TaxID=479676 RepID=A0AAV6IXT5_9ERIC|nr:hypothetical protein RHGRI_026750 [Rhododendron griersonianum]